MKKQSKRRGCLSGAILILVILLLGGGGWWLYRSQSLGVEGAAPSPVVVTITSPANGDEMSMGDFVPVAAQTISPDAIQSIELFLDGQSLGKVSDPSSASWTWQAWPLGIHSFYAQATDAKGQVGYSQVVIVNVLSGDGTLKVISEEGQTLEQIGAGYGVPPDQMTGANPKIDPSQPLPGGKPVQVPINNIEPPNVPGGNFISVKWKIKFNEPVDKTYCYVSAGNGVWEKIPKDPFSYFYGQETYYTQLLPAQGQSNIQVQCWAWVGGVLKYLGQGQGALDPSKTQGEVSISGSGFIFTGFFKMPPIAGSPPKALGGNNAVPPPYAFREPVDVAECAAHGDPLIAPLLCNAVMNASVKENTALVWEWKPETCLPGLCKYGVTKIAGYGVYEYDKVKQKFVLLADIKSPARKVAFPPSLWGGGKCYGVEAYVDYPGSHVSEMVTYCPGIQPSAKLITLKDVTHWVTSEDSLETGGCSYKFHDLPGGAPVVPTGWGSQPGQVLVGAYRFESSGSFAVGGSYCYMDGYYNSGVKFKIGGLPNGAYVQKAVLRFFVAKQSWFDGLFSGKPPGGTCISAVGRAKSDWSGLIDADHWSTKIIGQHTDYSGPSSAVKFNPTPQADVTAIVKGWFANPASNHGFIIGSVNPPSIYEDGQAVYCESALGDFKLDIYYIAPP